MYLHYEKNPVVGFTTQQEWAAVKGLIRITVVNIYLWEPWVELGDGNWSWEIFMSLH